MLLNDQHITEEIRKEMEICIETNENKNTTTQKTSGFCKSNAKGKVHRNGSLPQETRETSNK